MAITYGEPENMGRKSSGLIQCLSSRGILGYDTVYSCGGMPTFQSSMLPTSSPLQCWYCTTTPHGAITQQTSTWSITAMKVSKIE